MKLSRRGFVKFSAGSAAGLGLSQLSLKVLSDITVPMTEMITPPKGPESFSNTFCQLCPGGCGVKVRKIGSRVVRVQGNPNNPVNRTGLCPIGVSAPQYLYHPERLRFPMKREGQSWTRISWEQGLQEISSQLGTLMERRESGRVLALSHPLTGTMKSITEDLMRALGSNNLVELSGPSDGLDLAVRLMQGVDERPAYDLSESQYILSIGCEVLEGWNSPVWSMRGFSGLRGRRPRGRLTYAGPRESVTASKSDSWIRLRPGSEAAFALGIAYVLISERLYDFDFVATRCFGFEDWRTEGGELVSGFRRTVLERYPLNRASELTGVSPEVILRVAREFGSMRPALALAPPIDSVTPNSILGALCIHSLNALVGSIDRKGGVLLQYPDPLEARDEFVDREVPDVLADFKERVHIGEDPLQTLELALQNQESGPPPALLLLETDPLFDAYDSEALRSGLEQIPLVVSLSSFLNNTSQLANYILPTSTFLESWVEQSAPYGVPFSYQGLAEPALEPIGETRSCGDILLSLEQVLGLPVAGEDYGSLVRGRMIELYNLRRGAVAGTVFDQLWHQLMEESGWWAPTYESSDELVEQMMNRGGWWDSFYSYEDWSRCLRTPSGKFQFNVEELAALQDPASPA
ncbi:MAG: molybdopterin-dependent oxidoreductase, partial [Acidobacteriota bacterium]